LGVSGQVSNTIEVNERKSNMTLKNTPKKKKKMLIIYGSKSGHWI
jgi:hypothetical protein